MSLDTSPIPDTPVIAVWFQLISIIFTGSILLLTLFNAVFTPTPLEPSGSLFGLSPSTVTKSANDVQTIQAGILINSFKNFDMINHTFSFEGAIWFLFDPVLTSLDTISQFFLQKAEIKLIGDVKTKMIGDKIQARYDVAIDLTTPLTYTLFPFDDHILSIVLVNNKLSASQAFFMADTNNFIVKDSLSGSGWTEYDKRVKPGLVKEQLNSLESRSAYEKPAVEFLLYYRRSEARYMLMLILPMFVLFIIMLSTFSYDPLRYFSAIMGANGASLSGLIGFRFVIESMSPKVGYFMVSDWYFLTFLFLSTLIFLVSIIMGKLDLRVRYLFLVGIHAIANAAFIAIMFYVLWMH